MSQRSQSDGGQKGFAVGRGLLAAAETLNFSMNEQRSGRQIGGVALAMEGQDVGSQMSRHGAGSHLGSTMKLFASLGLSPSDLDALAQIPEEDISVDTLPQILMQLKSRKGEAGERRAAAASVSSDKSYRGGRDSWEDGGRMGGASLAQSSTSADFGFMQDVPSGRDFGLGFGGGRERSYSDLTRRDSYGGLNVVAAASDSVFMQRRMGSPSHGKVQDFLGVMPAMFPHVCSLCDFDVHSIMEWNQHVSALRHAENRRVLLNMYPEWDPSMGRSGSLLDSPNLSAGLHGSAPMSSGQTSSWGGAGGSGVSGKNQMGQNKLRSRVVVVKYDRKPLSNKTLFAFTEPFGRLREHLVLKNKAFLEMESHEEAQDVVSYYQQQPASLYGKPITFYLSQRLLVIEKEDRSSNRMDKPSREVKGRGSQVVFFSNLPREEEKKKELLTIAERFGTVEKHLFLTDQAFVQLGTPEDAEMLVKYYMVHRLTIKGRPIRLNICTKYKTLNVNRRQGGSAADARSWRGGASSASKSTSSFKPSSSSKDKAAAEEEMKEEEDEVVPGVVEGDDDDEEVEEKRESEEEEDKSAEAAPEAVRTETDASEELVVAEKAAGDDVAAETPAEKDGAEDEAKQEAEKPEEPQEAPTGEADLKEEQRVQSEMPEGDLLDTGEQDFLQNMEDFVTLDELPEDEDEAPEESDSVDITRKGGMRVVNIVGFRRGYSFLDELLGLAKPFGKVVKHLVLDLRPEAYLQFATEEEARAMAKFYNSNVTASVCGRPVRVSHSMTYPTIQCGSSKVVYVGQLPGGKYSDESVLKLAEPHGTVRKYFLNRIKRECFIEMEEAEEAERMAEEYKANPPKFNGKRLSIYVSRKYRQLKHGHRCPNVTKSEGEEGTKTLKHPEEPPAKKAKVETKPAEEKWDEEEQAPKKEELEEHEKKNEDEEKKEQEMSENQTEVAAEQQQRSEISQEVEDLETLTNPNGQTDVAPPPAKKASVASLPLPPFDPDSPIGVEHVKMGYYCRVCFLFYSNEDTAKRTHCSSQMHYDKLQKYLEKEQSKKTKGKKTSE